MRTSFLSAIVLSALLFILGPLAQADTNAQVIASKLTTSNFYVDPGATNWTDADSTRLLGNLKENDNVAVAILPKGAAANPQTLASEVSSAVPDRTIVLAAGDTIVVRAGANWPDQVTADDMLFRVSNVTSNVPDKLVRLIRVIHDWQTQNPKPVPPAPPQPPDYTGWYVSGGALAAAAVAGSVVFIVGRRNKRRKELYGAPRRYRSALKDILDYRDKFDRDSEVGRILTDICKLSVKYFRSGYAEDAAILHHHLRENVEPFLHDFWQMYDANFDKETYDNGQDALASFREFVGDIVRKGSVINTDKLNRSMDILRDARNSTNLP